MTAVADSVVADASLVLAAQAGDRDAFRQLFDRHVHRVAAVCRQRLRSPSDVDDAVQESFVRALTKINQLSDPDRFGAWVRSIAVRVCMDHHRAARRMIPVDGSGHEEIADHAPLPEELFEAQERGAAARGHLRELGVRDRKALWLRHVDEAPISAVAAELGLTEGSTRVMLARARQRLRAATTTLPALLPLSWRQWLRDHLSGAAPAIEAVVVAVAVGVMAVSVPRADAVEPAPTPPRDVTIQARGEHARRDALGLKPQTDAGRGRASTASEGRRSIAAPAAAPAQAPAADARRRPLERIGNSVDVRDEYPSEDESDEVVDLTVFGNAEEGNVRVYAKQLGSTGEAAYDTAADLLSGRADR